MTRGEMSGWRGVLRASFDMRVYHATCQCPEGLGRFQVDPITIALEGFQFGEIGKETKNEIKSQNCFFFFFFFNFALRNEKIP
jgi:hypothetical protein